MWARLAMAASVLMALTAFLCLLRVPLLPVHGDGFRAELWAYRLRTVVYLCPFALSLGVLIWAERRFKQGYRDDLWGEAELASVRRLSEWRAWASLSFGIAIVWLVALCFRHSLRGASIWYVLLMPSQTAQRIKQLIAPPVRRSSGLADWQNFGPLRSEHWGQRNA